MGTTMSLKYVSNNKNNIHKWQFLKIKRMLQLMTLALQFSNKLHICGGLRETGQFLNKFTNLIIARLPLYFT